MIEIVGQVDVPTERVRLAHHRELEREALGLCDVSVERARTVCELERDIGRHDRHVVAGRELEDLTADDGVPRGRDQEPT